MEYTRNNCSLNNFYSHLGESQLEEFLKSLPRKPYCMVEKPGFMLIRPVLLALRLPFIQINPPFTLIYLIFDIDHKDAAVIWSDENLPMPFWTTQNLADVQDPSDDQLESMGRGHLCYKLEIPVCTSEFASIKAIKYLQAIYYAYAVRLGADLNYSQLITKNPLHPQWRTTFWTDQAYSLDYLADFVDLPKKLPKKLEVVGLGRNVTMFEKGRHWAYKAIRDYMHHNSSYEWERAVKAQIEAINNDFEQPLPYSEVKATAKSIAKWVWQRFSYGDFSEIQAKRGAKGGAKSKRGPKEDSARSTKPWEALGVSRATYYRNKKNETK